MKALSIVALAALAACGGYNGGISHSIQSLGSTAFTSSPTKSANGQTYAVTFTTPGTYQYDCAVHGTAMSGTVVVR